MSKRGDSASLLSGGVAAVGPPAVPGSLPTAAQPRAATHRDGATATARAAEGGTEPRGRRVWEEPEPAGHGGPGESRTLVSVRLPHFPQSAPHCARSQDTELPSPHLSASVTSRRGLGETPGGPQSSQPRHPWARPTPTPSPRPSAGGGASEACSHGTRFTEPEPQIHSSSGRTSHAPEHGSPAGTGSSPCKHTDDRGGQPSGGPDSLSGSSRLGDKPVVGKTRRGWGQKIPDVASSSPSCGGEGQGGVYTALTPPSRAGDHQLRRVGAVLRSHGRQV